MRRLLVSGAVERAADVAAGIPPATGRESDGWQVFSEDAFGDGIGQIRLAIHVGDLELAARALTTAMPRQRDRVTLRIKLHLLDAMLQQRRNNRAAAHRALRRALELAQPGRMIRTFIDEGDHIVGMVREEYRNTAVIRGTVSEPFAADRAFLEQVLLAASCEGGQTPATPAPPLAELTDREHEILTFLASGVLNREMAERLYVSENTVKFHLKNIYSKLDVANRLQAVTAARQLGLIQA